MEPQPVEMLILAALQASPGLISLVGENIYAHKLPTGINLPALTYRRISGTPANHLRGYQTSIVKMAFDVWAMDKEYSQAMEIALEVQKSMSIAPVVNWLEMDQEMSFDNYYRITLEYSCQEKGGFEK